jgi:hypothetical protein
MKNFILAIVLLAVSTAAWAQANLSGITGSVKDSSGALIPGTQVAATDVATSVTTKTKTDDRGNYHLVGLPPAIYRVTYSHEGFKAFTQDSVTLVLNQTLELDPTLANGSANEQVTVTEAPSALDTTTASVADLVPARAVEGLPLNVRDPFALVGLTPGVQFGGNFGTGGAPDIGRGFYRDDFDIGGGRSGSEEILLDGAPNTTGDNNLNIIDPPIDSVLEFKVIANSYDAQYGRTSGGVVSFATKSGTNQIHGVAYEFTRHSIFDANDYFKKQAGLKLPSFARNQFGGDLGGPILRDKLFLFFDYEGLRQGYPTSNLATVPTALQRMGNFSQTFTSTGALIAIYNPYSSTTSRTQFQNNTIPTGMIDPVAAAAMLLYPLPNLPGNAITNQNNYIYSAKAITNTNKYDARVDFTLSNKTKMFVRYSRQQDKRLSSGNLPLPIGGGRSIHDHFTQAVVDLNHVITPNVLADITFSFGRANGVQLGQSNGFNPASLGFPGSFASLIAPQFPVFNMTDITGTSNGGDNIVSAQPRNVWSTLGVVYFQHGRHSMKFGGDTRNLHFNEGQNSQPDGKFSFDRTYTQGPTPTAASSTSGYGLASFLLGAATTGAVNQLEKISTQGLYDAVYAQDDWRVSDRLFINLGIRWDVEIGAREKYNRLASFDPNATSPLASQVGLPNLKGALVWAGQGNSRDVQATDWGDVGPRFGADFKVDSTTVFRGGYGIFYHPKITQGTNAGAVEAVRTTTMTTTVDNVTPYNTLSNPFPQGLLPPANDRNPLANVGQSLSDVTPAFNDGYSQLWSFGMQKQFAGGFVVDLHYWGNKGVRILNTYNMDQLPDQYLALGAALNTKVPNPFYGNSAVSGALALPTISLQQSLLPFPQYTSISQQYAPHAGSSYHAGTVQVDKRLSKTFTLLANYTWSKALDDARTPLDNYNRRPEKSFSPFDIRHQAHISFVYSIPYGHGRQFGGNQNRVLTAVLGDWNISQITNLQTGLPVSVSRPSVLAPGANPKLDHPTVAKWFNTSVFSPAPAYTFGNVGPYLSDVRTQSIHNVDAVLSKNFGIGSVREHPITATFRAEAYNLFNSVQFGFPNNNITSQSFGQVTSDLNAPRDMQFALKFNF